MGWASATGIFDDAVRVALAFIPTVNNSHKELMTQAVVENMYNAVNWDDWDTQDESDYFEPYLRLVMEDNGEIEKNEFV